MGWNIFNRKPAKPAEEEERDLVLPALTVSQAGQLTRLVHQALAEGGLEGVVSDGAIHLSDGRSYGLHNLSVAAAQEKPRTWPALVTEHLRRMDQIVTTEQEAPEDDAIFLRLRVREDLRHTQLKYDPLEPFPGIYALVAIDRPTHVAELTGDLEVVGSYERAIEVGRRNLAALPTPDTERVLGIKDDEDSTVHLLVSEDFFGASRAIVLEQTLQQVLGASIPEAGVFLVVPNRHLLAVHVPTRGDASTMAAITKLADIGMGECKPAPGPISPYVFHVTPDGSAAQVSRLREDGTIVITVDGQVEDAFRLLGIVV